MRTPPFLQRRVVTQIKHLLRMGVTPRRIALSIAMGTIIGIFPLLGTTTALCVVLSLALRLNIIAMQAFNWLVAGVQLMLILPFIRVGERLYRASPLPLRPEEIEAMFREGLMHATATLGMSLVHAVSAWLIVAPLIFAGAYLVSLRILNRLPRSNAAVADIALSRPGKSSPVMTSNGSPLRVNSVSAPGQKVSG